MQVSGVSRVFRQHCLGLPLVVIALGIVATAHTSALAQQADAKPNIVFILADDLGWKDIGYHDSDVGTPNLDRLAAGGVRFEQHYVCPTCSPTRWALTLGRNPSRFDVLSPSSKALPKDAITLPSALKKAGYSTHSTGKWHMGVTLDVGPRSRGYDTSYGYLHGQVDPYTHRYKFGDRTWHRNDEYVDEEGHATDLITREAVRVIDEAPAEKPFFLYVAYNVPHFPLNEPDDWSKPYADKINDPWRRQFAAAVTHMDAGVGKIVAALEKRKLLDRTLIVFSSDNGGQRKWTNTSSQYEGRYKPHTTLGNNLPLRGWKGDVYEGGIRVPAFACWPETLPEGKQVDAPIHIYDWMPTFCKLADVEVQPQWKLEGIDLWPLATRGAEAKPRTFYWRTPGNVAVRHGDWKLTANRQGEKAQLFDLASDPNETTELAAKEPEQLARLQKLLAAEREKDGATKNATKAK